MVLVDYSDSEASDAETVPAAASKAGAKKIDRTESKKIKVDLPFVRPELSQDDAEGPSRKRARTGGASIGFNSLLPAPKRTAQSGMKPGVNLKTSSEAAFSRVPAPATAPATESSHSETASATEVDDLTGDGEVQEKNRDEGKPAGKPTRFLPLSVVNAKKKKRAAPSQPAVDSRPQNGSLAESSQTSPAQQPTGAAPKPKRSLFSLDLPEEDLSTNTPTNFESEVGRSREAPETWASAESEPLAAPVATSNQTSLNEAASDLQLSASDRRRLFGRHAKESNINITRFDMDAEYRSNQELAAKGEVLEHRAVKAIAPGKHSLQQLVNNVRGQTDALEDKWAEGRRKRGEGGSKYGW